MSARAFADSNVLIYAIESEGRNVGKATVAREMIDRLRPLRSWESSTAWSLASAAPIHSAVKRQLNGLPNGCD